MRHRQPPRRSLPLLAALALASAFPAAAAAVTSEQADQWEELIHAATRARKGGDYPACFRYLDEAKEMARGFRPRDVYAVRLVIELGETHRQRGDWAQAERSFTEAVTLGENLLGPDSLDLTLPLDSLANYYGNNQQAIRLDRAEALQRRALAITERRAPGSPEIAQRARNLATTLQQLGRNEEGERYLLQSLTATDRMPPFERSSFHLDAARFYLAWERFPEAERMARRALEIREGTTDAPLVPGNSEQMSVALCYDVLGQADLGLNRPESAIEQFRKALLVSTPIQGEDGVEQSIRHAGLADAYLLLRRYAEAEPEFKRAIDIIRSNNSGQDVPELAPILEHYVLLLTATDRHAEAKAVEDRVAAIAKARLLGIPK